MGAGTGAVPVPRKRQGRPSATKRAELEELELPLDELELDELELEEELEDDELLLELDEELDDELLLELDDELDEGELDDELDDPELDDELDDGEELEESLGPVGVPEVHACSKTPKPARATLPERIRRNRRRSSRRASLSGGEE